MHPDALTIVANSKINLGLAVFGRRTDGFHEIETIFQKISLSDELSIYSSSKNEISFNTTGRQLPPGENLCVKAASLFFREFGIPPSVSIHLKKNIPIGAGLGGGSSDAAHTLMGLARHFGIDKPDTLRELGAELGSDVPFFFSMPTAIGRGRGEILEPISVDLPAFGLLIVPPFQIPTAWAYSVVAKRPISERGEIIKLLQPSGHFLDGKLLNDFEPAVTPYYPTIASYLQSLESHGARLYSMSGSGSVCFGLFDTDEYRSRAGRELATLFPDVEIIYFNPLFA